MSDVDVLWLLASWTLVVPSEWANWQADASSDSLVQFWAFLDKEIANLGALLSVLLAFFSLGRFGQNLGLWLHAPVSLIFPSFWACDGTLATSLILPSLWALSVDEGRGDSGAVSGSVNLLTSLISWLKVKAALVDLSLELFSESGIEQNKGVQVLNSRNTEGAIFVRYRLITIQIVV